MTQQGQGLMPGEGHLGTSLRWGAAHQWDTPLEVTTACCCSEVSVTELLV